jgi:hypothetical protein
MSRRAFRIVAPSICTFALVAGLIATGTPSAGASSAGTPTSFRGTTPALSSVATTQRAAVRATGGSAAIAFEAGWLRTHQFEGEELEGGAAIRMGEVAAPKSTSSASVTSDAYGLVHSWEGSNHFDSRYSGNGNQFSGEPPDQGLCANDTRVFEIVNNVVQVYSTSGKPLLAGDSFFPNSPPVGITLAEFFGNPPDFQRPDGPFGPNTAFDVSCRFDSSVQRWYVSAEYLDLDRTTGDYTGNGGFYVAVSTSANPLGSWNIWDTRTQNNGTEGTPDHHCSSGFCYGDYPQLGFDANGLYITTNEFDFFTGAFSGAQLYAFSKADLVAGDPSPTTAYLQSVQAPVEGDVAYSMQPVISQPADFVSAHGGTEYLAMSQSPYAVGAATGISLWRLTNTSSLNATPRLALTETSVPTQAYTGGVHALQKPGPTPLLDCENSKPCIGAANPVQKSPLPTDGGSGKVYGAWLRGGVVYLTTATAVAGSGGAEYFAGGVKWRSIDLHGGVAWFALRPSTTTNAVQRVNEGIVDVPGQNMTYPTVAMNAAGDGVIGVTLVGPGVYPTAAYIPFTTAGATAAVEIAGAGVGPNDGFTGTADGDYRTRWGDYGAADVAPDGTVWFANEYIAQRCTDATFNADPTCGFTRSFFANWSTRVSAYHPS